MFIPQVIYERKEPQRNDIERGKPKNGKTCSSATFFTTNSTWTELDANKGLCGERQATNRLSNGRATEELTSSIITLMMDDGDSRSSETLVIIYQTTQQWRAVRKMFSKKKKVKQSRYTTWRRLGGEEI
jgi:hypothetical protein